MDAREAVTLSLPPDQALEHCRLALERARFSAVRMETASRMVRAHGKMTWTSFGEEIECRVEIRSRPVLRATLFDFGINRGNVARIHAALAKHAPRQALAATAPPEGSSPGRPARVGGGVAPRAELTRIAFPPGPRGVWNRDLDEPILAASARGGPSAYP